MRLQKIKLAGFKSFVDPTTISLPRGLVGVVGPNGCGKSNIIDAVRWVMGEISAKHLRGDSMADVVFNGSTARKPVGQASVEIVFDNSDGTLGGQYAQYNEISVRRQVTRDGQSSYFLNGSRCRRRDVTGIFMGTGLGSRSYAIIEQGMISRLVEAKPDDLREFLEEAAGISKYKERRRETENRIRHTRENMDRLNDLREELHQRLRHLRHQAATAEKYKVLKQEERLLRAQFLALRWRALDGEARGHDGRMRTQETALEAAVAEQRRVESALTSARAEHTAKSDAFNERYREVLDTGAEIARFEETIQHLRRRQEQLQQNMASEERALAEAREHLDGEQAKAASLGDALHQAEPELAELERTAAGARAELNANEEAMQDWQSEWESVAERIAVPARAAEAEGTRIQSLEERLLTIDERRARLRRELEGIDPDEMARELQAIQVRLEQEEQAQEEQARALEDKQGAMRHLREQAAGAARALDAARERYQEATGRLASLQTLQEAALGKRPGAVMEWLHAQGLAGHPRLAEQLSVEPGWERAVETVLGFHLEAVCVPHLDALADGLPARVADFPGGSVALFDINTARHGAGGGAGALMRLAEKVTAPWALDGLLDGVLAVDTLENALALRRQGFAPGQSAITPGGDWVGRAWIRVSRDSEEGAGLLAREQEIKQLEGRQRQLRDTVAGHESALNDARGQIHRLEEEAAGLQAEFAVAHRRYAAIKSEFAAGQVQVQQLRQRGAQLEMELAELRGQADADNALLGTGRRRLEALRGEMGSVESQRDALVRQRDAYRQRLHTARERWQQERDHAHQVALRAESLRTQLGSLEQSRVRNRELVERLEARCEELRQATEETGAPMAEARSHLEARLSRRGGLEKQLEQARRALEEVESSLRDLEQERHRVEARVDEQRQTLNELRLESQAARVRRDAVAEQLVEAGFALDAMLEGLPEEAEEAQWAEKLAAMERRIARLGPINLAAIDEFEQQSERKEYLDSQHGDLSEALETLLAAIQTIDRETRTRFKDTYERVNAGLATTFPRLFGGGHACLELTGTDLLSTGITVMARPPGKRNSTIHLLSGGREGIDRGGFVVCYFRAQPGTVLPPGRGGCPAGRCQRGTLLHAGQRHGGTTAACARHPQQDHHGNRPATYRCYHE